MWRRATGTPIVAAIAACDSDTERFRAPLEAQLVGRRHVADQRRRGDDHRAGEKAFAAEAHPVLPVAIEGGDRALALVQSVRSLAEAGAAPRLPDLAADRAEHLRDRFAGEPRVGPLDLPADASGAGEDDELGRGLRHALRSRGPYDERRRQEVVVAAVGAGADHRLVERQPLARDFLR